MADFLTPLNEYSNHRKLKKSSHNDNIKSI